MSTQAIIRLRSGGDDYMVPEWTLGDRMRKALEVSGTPVQEIAEYLDVSRVTVGRWIHDRTPVKRHVLLVWAATTGVDPDWLETGTASPEAGRSVYAIRDSNPEPADMASRPAPEPQTPLPGRESGRHLRAVS
jgi:transcriptional regulator with XRE-family HTH domain